MRTAFTRETGSLGQGKDRRCPVLTEITFERPAASGCPARPVTQQLKAVRVTLKAPARPDRTLPEVSVTALLAEEINLPLGEAPLQWLLLTNLPVENADQALEKLSWSLCRWQVEVYFKILISGCKIEELQLETRERLEPALSFYMIIARRVLFLTHLGRECPEMSCDAVFADARWQASLVTRGKNPGRWSSKTRDWNRVDLISFKPEQDADRVQGKNPGKTVGHARG